MKARLMVDSSRALTRSSSATELALPTDLIEQAREYAINSRSERTQREYARCWNQFETWCKDRGQTPLPATVQVLIAYVTDLAVNGGPKGKPLAISSIQQALAALLLRHSMAGAPVEQFASPVLKEVMKGVRRKIASTRPIRRVRPLLENELINLLEMLRPDSLRDARDAALIALGFGAARRRSELVGLDYLVRGDGRGVLTIDDRGITLKLLVSKTNQEGAEEEYIVPRATGQSICKAVENWISLAGIRKGEPLFRGIHTGGQTRGKQSRYQGVTWREANGMWQAVAKVEGKTKFLGYFKNPHDAYLVVCSATGKTPDGPSVGRVLSRRLRADTVALIVKQRIQQLLLARTGRKRLRPDEATEIDEIVSQYSGHSMRSGLVTSAADRGVPIHHIKAVTGHKTDHMVGVYSRSPDKTRNSSLKGSGL